ncbi:MAG: flagellar motor switch protein FliM [Chloroflexi bacterium]|nr:flagellar motor switch protein FliM [Chloroflexota bacterium]
MLSQAEIDALLSGAIQIEGKDGEGGVNLANLIDQPQGGAKEGEPGKKAQAYNFWSPDRFSKEQMRAVELMHEDLAERLNTSLAAFLHSNLRPRVAHTEQGRFPDFIKDTPADCLFHIITLAPLPGQIILTISPEISQIVLEQRLGARIEGQRKERGLTEIDQSLLRGLVEHMLSDIQSSWAKVVAIEPALEDSTVNQHRVQMMVGNEKVLLIAFELSMQNITGAMNIYIPFSTLKPIANVLNPRMWIAGRKERQVDPSAKRAALEAVSQVKLPVQVFLGKARLSVGEMINLEAGDIVPLDTGTNQSLTMQIAGRKLFKVQIGKVGNRLAVQVEDVIREEGKIA